MSGQLSTAEYEQTLPLDLDASETSSPQLEIEDRTVSDPVANFLEKHGHELTRDHGGNLVTYYDAVNNCPPFRALVQAMGEAVLGMTADTHTPETDEDEQEESEIKEVVEERDRQGEETKGAEAGLDNIDQKEPITSKKTPEKVPRSNTYSQKQEVPQLSNKTAGAEAIIDRPSVNAGPSATGENIATQPEKKTQNSSAQDAKTVATPTLGDSYESGKTAAFNPEQLSSEQTSIKLAKSQTLPPPETGSNAHQAGIEKKIWPNVVLSMLPELSDLQVEVADPKVDLEEQLSTAETILTIVPEYESIDLLPNKKTGDDNFLIENEEYQIPTPEVGNTHIDIELNEVLPEDSEDFVLPIEEIQPFDLPEYIGGNVETVHALSLPVKEVEQTILELAECLEGLEEEKAEEALQILDEVVQKVEQARASMGMEDDAENTEGTFEAEEVEEELRELFIQLFDYVGIEHSPELIELCVKLVLEEGMPDLILTTEQEDDSNTPQDEGTHEIVRQLLAAISSIKQAILRAYHLGKSALWLYSQELATA